MSERSLRDVSKYATKANSLCIRQQNYKYNLII